MNNKAVIAVVAILVILVGGYGSYRVYKHFKRLASVPSQTQVQPSSAPSAMKSLKDLLGLGVAQKCTFDQGTVYIANGKVRGDFASNQNGPTTMTHMITMGGASYIWMEGQKTGFKMSFDINATPGASSNTNAATSGAPDFNQPANYNCGGWTVDSSLFVLPAGVNFQDMSSLVPSMAPKQTAPSAAPYIPQGY